MKFTTIATTLAIALSTMAVSATNYPNEETVGVMVKSYADGKFKRMLVSKGELEALRSNPEYASVEEDTWIGVEKAPKRTMTLKKSDNSFIQSQSSKSYNDPDYAYQYYFQTQTDFLGAADIANAASQSVQNKKLRIAVLDGGFEDHEDLPWSYGYNFFDEWGETRGPEFRDLTDEQKECSGGHGLSVGSIIGATANNGIGMAGVVDADMIALRVLSCGIGPMSDLADAIKHAAGAEIDGIPSIEPVDIINISIAGDVGGCPSFVQDAIDYANEQGVMIFVAAGNKNEDITNYAPASCNGVYVVGASTRNGFKAEFSNHGEKVDSMMAGVDIIGYSSNGETGWWEGTSQATPLTVGIAALGLQHDPSLTRDELFTLLKQSASDLRDDVENADQDCTGNKCGSGLVNANTFMEHVIASQSGGLYKLEHALAKNTVCDQELIVSSMGNTLPICQMYELSLLGLSSGDTYKVVKAEIGQEFDSFSEVLVQGSESKLILDSIELDSYKYGVRICTTNTCETEAVVEINTENAQTPAICD